jgi:hypothetical protein
MANPLKAVKAIKKLTGARAAKDAKIVASSPHLKQTPNMTKGQAKRMKQGTKSLAKTTNKISRKSNKNKLDKITIGEYNDFLKRIGRDKPTEFAKTGSMRALDTPSLGGAINAPRNLTMREVNRGRAVENQEKAKAYAAAYRVAKRETKSMKSAMQSKTTRTVKKVAKASAVAGTAGGAYAASKKKRGK